MTTPTLQVAEGSCDTAKAGVGGAIAMVSAEELTASSRLDPWVEKESLEWLHGCVVRALEANFATTVEEDEALLLTADFRAVQVVCV